MFVSLSRQLKCVAQHAIDATPRENRLLHGHFIFCSFIEAAADVRVFPFVVFTNNAKVNLTGHPVLERALNPLKQSHRPQIHVLPEAAAKGDEQPPQRNMVRNGRVSNGAEENGVKRPELHTLPFLTMFLCGGCSSPFAAASGST